MRREEMERLRKDAQERSEAQQHQQACAAAPLSFCWLS